MGVAFQCNPTHFYGYLPLGYSETGYYPEIHSSFLVSCLKSQPQVPWCKLMMLRMEVPGQILGDKDQWHLSLHSVTFSTMLHFRSVSIALDSWSAPVMTFHGASALEQSYPINSPTLQFIREGISCMILAKCFHLVAALFVGIWERSSGINSLI